MEVSCKSPNSAVECKEAVDWASFPILLLPVELIFKIFKIYLPFKDQLRARVNWRLFEIEASQKHSFDALIIRDDFKQYKRRKGKKNNVLELHLKDVNNCDTYVAILRKLATNCEFHQIFVQCRRTGFKDVLEFVASMKTEKLYYNDSTLSNELMELRQLEHMMEDRECFTICNFLPCLNAQFLLDSYEVIKSGHDSLRALNLHDVRPSVARKTLAGLGLHTTNVETEDWIKTDRDITVWSFISMAPHARTINSDQGVCCYLIKIGEMAVVVGREIMHDFDDGYSDFNFGIQKFIPNTDERNDDAIAQLVDYPMWDVTPVTGIAYIPDYAAAED